MRSQRHWKSGLFAVISLLTAIGIACCNNLMSPKELAGLCGDGKVQLDQGEECDDGNRIGGDGCTPKCKTEACGNGRKDEGEQCDNGTGNDSSGDCTLACKKPRCGDGHIKTRGKPPFETCDDGNLVNGDGCNPQCSLRGRVSVLAGIPGGMGIANGVGPAARVARVSGMAMDGDTLYFADTFGCTIRRLDILTGQVSTIAGVPGHCPFAINNGPGAKATFSATDKRLARVGTMLYVSESGLLRRVDLASGSYDVLTCAAFPALHGTVPEMTADPTGKALYLASDTAVYQVKLPCSCNQNATSNRCTLSLLAGGSTQEVKDGNGSAARFFGISALEAAPSGGLLYVGDVNLLRTLDTASAEVKTVAGSSLGGHLDGVGLTAKFAMIQGLVGTSSGLYVLEQSTKLYANAMDPLSARIGWANIRHVSTTTWKVETVAGIHGTILGGATPEQDGFGPFARFLDVISGAAWRDTIIIGESASIRTMSRKTGQVSTASGVLVQDFTHHEVRAVATYKGSLYSPSRTGDLLEIPLQFSRPWRKLPLCPITVAGAAHGIRALTSTKDGLLFVADAGIDGICQVDLQGKQGSPCCTGCKETCKVVYTSKKEYEFLRWRVSGMAHDGRYIYVVANFDSKIYKIDPITGHATEISLASGYRNFWSIVHAGVHLYATVPHENVIVRIDPSSGACRTIGSGLAQTLDGKGSSAGFCRPAGITTDGTNLFVGETHCEPSGGKFHGHAVRQVSLKDESVTTLLGPGPRPYLVTGAGSQGSVNWPAALTWDANSGALYLADMWANVLVKID